MRKSALLTSILFSAIFLFSVNSVSAEYGSSSSTGSTSTGLPSCNSEIPARPVLYQPNHPVFGVAPKTGEVYLRWTKADRANKYQIFYGYSSRNYVYSVTDTGDVNDYTIKGLNPGMTYYFAIKAINGCRPSEFSNEWSNYKNVGTLSFAGGNTVLGLQTRTNTQEKVATDSSTTVEEEVIPTEEPIPTAQVIQTESKTGFFQAIWDFIKKLFGAK
jgi:hypothetical protein